MQGNNSHSYVSLTFDTLQLLVKSKKPERRLSESNKATEQKDHWLRRKFRTLTLKVLKS